MYNKIKRTNQLYEFGFFPLSGKFREVKFIQLRRGIYESK